MSIQDEVRRVLEAQKAIADMKGIPTEEKISRDTTNRCSYCNI